MSQYCELIVPEKAIEENVGFWMKSLLPVYPILGFLVKVFKGLLARLVCYQLTLRLVSNGGL